MENEIANHCSHVKHSPICKNPCQQKTNLSYSCWKRTCYQSRSHTQTHTHIYDGKEYI